MTENDQTYRLHLDGRLFRKQRELLMKIANLARQKRSYVPMPGNESLLEGLLELTDAIADQAHDRHGIACLLEKDTEAGDYHTTDPAIQGTRSWPKF